MKKLILSAAMLLTIGFTANAQNIKFGVKAGLNLATLTGDVNSDVSSRTNFHAGGVVEFKVAQNFSVQPELLYSGQGAKFDVFQDGANYETTFKFDYINIPVLAKYYIIEGFSIEAGPQVGFIVNSKMKVEIPGMGSGEVDAEEITNGVDFGIAGGLAYDLPIGLFFQARYVAGIANVIDEPNTSTQNGVFQFSVGYKF
jgi:hypothetical protein